MPVAAATRRPSARPHRHDTADHDTADAGMSMPPGDSCPDSDGDSDGEFTDAEAEAGEVVVAGYLCAVAAALHERGIAAASVTLHGLGAPDGRVRPGPRDGIACGTLTLQPTTGTGPSLGWGPTQVDWHPDTGWSARLRRGSNGHLTIWRYLHAALVPAPAVAAGFIAALGTAEDVGQPVPAVFGERRRRVLTELRRFAVGEPC